ncbi:winged helix-turn-helix transcriptional regulator [Micromonospora sonneratiae]|uniref:Winged helix-turn-helix transcriptional regulator n=1 Tax=Micromonospora sonneratiae TaxID=1184706 RepID=A0ABW3YHY7_9ACTN
MKVSRERRSYDQQCGLAHALDIVGERWTLLIIRELLVRPRRYGELLDALQGIGTNLLADRLSFLVEAGVVMAQDAERRTGGYALTELGKQLREPVLALARFGLAYATERPAPTGGLVRPGWAMLAVEALVSNERTPPIDESYDFDVDGELFHVVVAGGRARIDAGPATEPALRVRTDASTLFGLGLRRIDPLEAVLEQKVQVAGAPAAMTRCLRLLGLGGA